MNILDVKESATSRVDLTIVKSDGLMTINPKKPIPLGTTIKLKFTLRPDADSREFYININIVKYLYLLKH